MTTEKFSQFTGPSNLQSGDIVVGLRSGTNYQFNALTGSVSTINGDSGSATGTSLTLRAGPNQASGYSVTFTGSGSTLQFGTTDSFNNTLIGKFSGSSSISGALNNTGLGASTLTSMTNGAQNTAISYSALNQVTSGSSNCAIGYNSGNSFTSGSYNTFIGTYAGSSYLTTASSNISIGYSAGGVGTESNTIRIGVQGTGTGQQNICYIAGIAGASVSNMQTVVVNTSTGQLGSTSLGVFTNNINAFIGQQYFQQSALIDASPIAWNLNIQQVGTVLLTSAVGATRQLQNPTNMAAGGTYILTVKQSSTGSNALTYGTAYKWPGGSAPLLSTAANAIDILTFVSDGTNMYGVIQNGFA